MNIPNKYNDITGAILAGGKNDRMRSNKAMLMFEGKTFIQRLAEICISIFKSTIIISYVGKIYSSLGLEVYPDIFKDCGPLGGIHSALTKSNSNYIFVISCDLPLIQPEIIKHLISYCKENEQIILPSYKETIQPLCGIYKRDLIPLLENYLSAGKRKVFDLLNNLNPIIVPFDSYGFGNVHNPFESINTPEQYQNLLSEVSGG
jgi:molybdenum cofactor guanylyltransferase